MSLAKVFARTMLGVDAIEVCVETHLSNGLPGFAIVGMPETTVRESKERVRSAILNSGLDFPARRITVNLAPADLPKTGAQFDLAIALSILLASRQIPKNGLSNVEVMGELALQGDVRKIQGIVPALLAAKKSGREVFIPKHNEAEAALVRYEKTNLVSTLLDFVEYAREERSFALELNNDVNSQRSDIDIPDFMAVKGQLLARRAIQLAAAGSHNLLMIGPPGCGKTLLANNLIKLLPRLNEQEAMEVASIRSVIGESVKAQKLSQAPIRNPHHSCTHVALVGGGNKVSPGEVSLSHRGVLFLDELTEFKASALDALREPIENGEIVINRANYRVKFPAQFQLVAAMNPCPCGNASDPRRECRCTSDRVARYLNKLSGPLLDRIDIQIELPSLTQAELLEQNQTDNQKQWLIAKEGVRRSREIQLARAGKLNSELTTNELEQYCGLNKTLRTLLADAMDKLGMSARGIHRVIKLARTIADTDQSTHIEKSHVLEAISYRRSSCLQRLGR